MTSRPETPGGYRAGRNERCRRRYQPSLHCHRTLLHLDSLRTSRPRSSDTLDSSKNHNTDIIKNDNRRNVQHLWMLLMLPYLVYQPQIHALWIHAHYTQIIIFEVHQDNKFTIFPERNCSQIFPCYLPTCCYIGLSSFPASPGFPSNIK